MAAYYNEYEPFAAEWLRNLIKAGLIADGEVDERSIVDVDSRELAKFTQCHFFAGIGVWSHALRQAVWSDDRPVWSGSCPCQPFSVAGAGKGTVDERHLWPEFFRLIKECRPTVVVGEQVASPAALAWLDSVQNDLEGEGYAVGSSDLCAAGIGAPHIRQRLYWVAHTPSRGQRVNGSASWNAGYTSQSDAVIGLADDDDDERLERRGLREAIGGRDGTAERAVGSSSVVCGMADAGSERRQQDPGSSSCDETENGREGWNGSQSNSNHITASDGADGVRMANPDGPGQQRENTPQSEVRECDTIVVGTSGHLSGSPLGGFWADAIWIPCTDGKARPTQPKYVTLFDGDSCRMGYGGSNGYEIEEKEVNVYPSEARSSEVLFRVQETNAPSEIQRSSRIESEFSQEKVLQSEVHGFGADARSSNESESFAFQGQRSNEERLRDLRKNGKTSRTPQGQKSVQQRDQEFADFVQLLPSSFALSKISRDTITSQALLTLLQTCGAEELVQHPSYEVQEVWRSLAQETQNRLRVGFEQGRFVRSFESPLVHGAQNRAGKLRAYGNSLCAPVAEEFIKAVIDCIG